MANQTNVDQLYQRSREDLLSFEDSRLNSLLTSVANYYTTRNDQSTWGNFLRALAIELARLDYMYSYDIVNKDPSFLTPPDIRRRWADPLYVSANWPSKTQFDSDFKTMLVELIAAYRMGSTVASIQDVIFAYTGIHIAVEELYKQIGNGVFDQSDRNSIKVSVSVGGSSISQITTLTQLQSIVQSLYGAIDLAKPAHVGLEFTAIFGEGDEIDCFISPQFVTQQQYITLTADQQSLYTQTAYALTNAVIFWQASTPTSNAYAINTVLRDSNGNLQLATVAGKPGTTVPVWNTVSGGLTTDDQIVWKNISPQPTSIALTSNVVTVTVPNIFVVGDKITPFNLAAGDNFSFLNGQPLTVVSATSTVFTAAFTHSNVGSHSQSQGTLEYIPDEQINLLAFQLLSPTFQSLYQAQYTNTNCTSDGIEDTLRIFVKQVELPPFDPMLIQAPVLDPTNPQTTVAGFGRHMAPVLSSAAYAALQNITFNVVNTVSDGTNLGYTFNVLSAPGTLPLHEGERVTIAHTTNGIFLLNLTQAATSIAVTPATNPPSGTAVYTGSISGGNSNFIGATFLISGFTSSVNNGTFICVDASDTTLTLNNAFAVNETHAATATSSQFNTTGKIRNVTMITPTSGTFEIPLPVPAVAVSPQAESGGKGIVTPTIQAGYTSQAGQFVVLQTPPLVGDPTTNVNTDAIPAALNPASKWIMLSNVDNTNTVYVTGEISNWDINHSIGLVAPRLSQVWEIQDDQDFLFGI